MQKKKKIIKRRIKWKHFLPILIFIGIVILIYLIGHLIPINHIIINGNHYVSDSAIIKSLDYQEYPCLFCVSNKSLKDTLLKNPYITKVNIQKSILGELKINIEEAKPLFYNRNNNHVVLSNGNEIIDTQVLGIPILTNYVPENIYKKLIESMKNLSEDTILLISEIIYEPWKNGDIVIDETRFFLRMNDGNHVYTNTIHFDKLNNYMDIYATLEGKKGTLYLDSSSDKISFSLF